MELSIIKKHNLQAKFSKFINKVTHSCTIKEKKFVKELVSGILKSGSCIIRRIAMSHEVNISLEKLCERYRRHLSKPELYKNLSNIHLICESKKIASYDLIVIDPSDIMKSHSKKMEGLTRVRDGSTGEWCNGYEVLDIIRVSKEGHSLEIRPLVSELHTNDEDPGILKQSVFDRINDIQVYSGNKGIYVMDRGYDDKVVINYLTENEASYIIRVKGNRNLYVNGKEISFKKATKHVKLKYRIQSGNATLIAGVIRVGVPVDAHHKKKATLVYSNLVVARYIKKDESGKDCLKGFFYLNCDFPNRDLSDLELITTAIRGYRLRWKVEEVHRHVKQEYSWEDMQVMTLDRLRNLNCMLLLAVSYLYSLDKYRYDFAEMYQHIMLSKKSNLKELCKFIYYRLSVVVKNLFRDWKHYFVPKYQGCHAEWEQMTCL